ncbi:hypothetical protein KEC58_20850 (plasmid) [Photobacterium damselae]|uniref:hypothetical protein n=1 Tax=Photobacterium damselae TaxID=38293 RepID=UPI0025437140
MIENNYQLVEQIWRNYFREQEVDTVSCYPTLGKLIGFKASAMLICLLDKKKMSEEEVIFVGQVLNSLIDYPTFEVSVFDENKLAFSLTAKLCRELTGFDTSRSYYIKATPQKKWQRKTQFNDGGRPYEMDLFIQLMDGQHEVAKMAVEYDGPFHLNEKQVRGDKYRDAHIQSDDIPVFRFPSENQHLKPIDRKADLEERTRIFVTNISDFFRTKIGQLPVSRNEGGIFNVASNSTPKGGIFRH